MNKEIDKEEIVDKVKLKLPIFNNEPRDHQRIPELLTLLEELWMKQWTDLRFFQFVHNLSSDLGLQDPYNYEDSRLIEYLKDKLGYNEG